MIVKQEVLTILENRRGESVSGEEIAEKLSVSRNCVWKAIRSLRLEGHEIEAGTNRGYRLTEESGRLSAQSVTKHLSDKAKSFFRVETKDKVTSTNTVIKELGEKGEAEGFVMIAQEQTHGKGRLGRSFYSPPGTGLYMSILLRPPFTADKALFITTSAAVAVARAIEETTGREAKIKWVNDIYCDGKKVCGILTEASMNFENAMLSYAVLGIGINISDPPGGFLPELREIVGSVCRDGAVGDIKSRLAASVLNSFLGFYEAMEEKAFLQEYRSRSFLTGEEVAYEVNGKKRHATVIDIDDMARLVVRLPDGSVETLGAGEVSVRKKERIERGTT